MSFYEDSTLLDLPVILTLVSLAGNQSPIIYAFVNATADEDLAEVLNDLALNMHAVDPLRQGQPAVTVAIRAIQDALQGIEDSEQTAVSCQTPNDEVSLVVSIGGSVVEMP